MMETWAWSGRRGATGGNAYQGTATEKQREGLVPLNFELENMGPEKTELGEMLPYLIKTSSRTAEYIGEG